MTLLTIIQRANVIHQQPKITSHARYNENKLHIKRLSHMCRIRISRWSCQNKLATVTSTKKFTHFNLMATFLEVCFQLPLVQRAPLCNFWSSYEKCQQCRHKTKVTQGHYKTNKEPCKTTQKRSKKCAYLFFTVHITHDLMRQHNTHPIQQKSKTKNKHTVSVFVRTFIHPPANFAHLAGHLYI